MATAARYGYTPDYAVAPGRTLSETIQALGMSQAELADRTDLSKKHINQIVQGKAVISHDVAIRLECATGVPARIWNNLETNYRAQLATIDERRRSASQVSWLDHFPVKELARRGAIRPKTEPSELVNEILRFFGVASVAAWNKLWMNPDYSFRRSGVAGAKIGAVASWLRLAEIQAQTIQCAAYNRPRFLSALQLIRELAVQQTPDILPKTTAICAGAGVAFVTVPKFAGAPICGAAKWLNPDKAMIVLNLHVRLNDRFWFGFFHEAGHILHDSKKTTFIDVDFADDEREKRTNRFVADFLIPPARPRQSRSARAS